mmetsp:Transcript_18106/g.38963  ORF Transcript_18106/g.38963 Transcript_18106/m.38963 type:complete len:770 (+) Transcript_18106:366-2675(+)|eukprot:CAMPEP_0202906870 /NCGR_PEP_ID=MMETSP1392-20130828/40546_1 /ASSEMBLY_ACC=CAM_ASM_000868 /TAXON_ID=225041 /ORGANISM="Chlamydomonas chlamydogama, Strain SAG 11-48b" /LENGTH=769 /DNA_ID=CAMNT_0049595547 /DNA_START=288 /DNA_END=2597 /DNA_ORIENTATION=-
MGEKKKRYITYRVDTYLKDKFLNGKNRRPREYCGEHCMRFLNFTRFCCVCSASLFQALAPWMLCTMEVVAVLLIYFLGTSRSLVIHEEPKQYHFSYTHSLEDIVGLSCTRSALLSIAYAAGVRHSHRPYLYASYLLAAACFPYVIVKTILYRYGQDAVSAAAIFVLAGAFSWFHVFAARRTVEWSRRRYQMGLAGFGYPWEEGEEAWTMLRRPDLEEMTKTSDGGRPDGGEDVPPETMADDDSKFVEVCGVKVHYKEVIPSTLSYGGAASSATSSSRIPPESVGIVLVHGFGGGVFAWRHVMEPLSMQCQCRVIAFDRPAFGLTSRPAVSHDQRDSSNPYALGQQAFTMLDLCAALGLKYIVIVAHADGCLLALRSASMAAVASTTRSLATTSMMPPVTVPGTSSRSSMRLRTAVVPQASEMQLHQASSLSADCTPRTSSLVQPATASGSQGGAHDGGSGSSAPQASGTSGSQGGAAVGQSISGVGAAGMYTILNAADAAGASEASSSGDSVAGLTGGAAGRRWPSSNGTEEIQQGLTSAQATDHDVEACHSQRGSSAGGASNSSAHHRRCVSLPGPASSGASASNAHSAVTGAIAWPHVLGMALLHPNLSGQMGPALSRLLARSKLGRSILRPLLRTEVGEVANRRAWHNTDKLTQDVLELYKAPLRVEGWDAALIETTRLKREHTQGDLASYVGDARPLPVLLVTAEHDRIVPVSKVEQLCSDLPKSRMSVLADCGHLSHEESPGALLEQLVPFCGDVLLSSEQTAC